MTEWFYRLLLRIYPRPFRERFGEDLLATAREVDRRGHRSAVAAGADAVRGAITLHREYRAERRSFGGPVVSQSTIGRDVRFAVRTLRRTPGFSLFVIGILALAIGANAALFGIADRLLLSGPDHVIQAERVRRLYLTVFPPGMHEFTSSTVGHVTFDAVRRSGGPFEGVAAYQTGAGTIGRGEGARAATVGHASSGLFPLLGVQPVLGRFISDAEDAETGAARVAVIAERTWHTHFGGAADVLGRTLIVNDEPATIVGVAPRGFTGVELAPVDVWLPLNLLGPRITRDWRHSWSAQWLEVVVRLSPAATPDAAASALTSGFRAAYDGDEAFMREARLWLGELSRTEEGTAPPETVVMRWLWGVAALVLLIAGANVTNLLLARGARRAREVGIRLALGASRAAVARMLVIEALLLALGGALLGMAVAALVGDLARSAVLDSVEWTASPVNGRVLGVSIVLAILLGTVTGVIPALAITRGALARTLKSGARDGGGQRLRLRAALTVVQAALCVVLLIGAGLFIRSTSRARSMDLGFDPSRVLVVEVNRSRLSGLPPERQASERERRRRFLSDIVERIAAVPGVEAAAVAVGTPFGNRFSVRIVVPGMDALPKVPTGGPTISAVGAGYFPTMGTNVVRGRGFTPADRGGSAPVAIVSAFMAATVWPGEDPIGRCLEIGEPPAPCATIVGIAEDTHRSRLVEAPRMHVYIPHGQERGWGGDVLLVRGQEVAGLVEPVRRVLLAADGSITYVEAEPLQARIDPQLRSWELGMSTLGFSGILALIVAALGIYSVVSYIVADRRREIGVRVALGARTPQVTGMVLRWSLGMAALGCGLGAIAGGLAAPHVEPMLFQVSGRDPEIYAAVAATLMVIAAAASLGPCLAALRVDPIEALRAE